MTYTGYDWVYSPVSNRKVNDKIVHVLLGLICCFISII